MKLITLIKDNKTELFMSLLLSLSIYIVLVILLYTVDHYITPDHITPNTFLQCMTNTFIVVSAIMYSLVASYIFIIDSKTVIEADFK